MGYPCLQSGRYVTYLPYARHVMYQVDGNQMPARLQHTTSAEDHTLRTGTPDAGWHFLPLRVRCPGCRFVSSIQSVLLMSTLLWGTPGFGFGLTCDSGVVQPARRG